MRASISLRDAGLVGLVLLVGACAGDGCGSCSCKGGEDVESTRSQSVVTDDPIAARARPRDPGNDPESDEEADPQARSTGGSTVVGTTNEPSENEPDPTGATATGVLDRPTSGQVGVVLRDMRERAAECSRGVRRSVVVEMTISGRSGRATSARAIGPSAGTPEAACVESLMREAQFPTFERPEMRTAYAYRIPGADPDGGAVAIEADTENDGGMPALDDAGDSDAAAAALRGSAIP